MVTCVSRSFLLIVECLLLFSCWVVSDSLQPRKLQDTVLPYPSLSPGVCSNTCPLSWWCYLTISSFAALFSFCHQPFPLGFPDISAGEESACNAGDPGSVSGLGRSTGEGIGYPPQYSWASLVAQLVKNPPAMQETWVSSLGWADPLEKGKATHSTFWAWRIPWTVSSMRSQRVGHSWETFTHFPQHWGLFHWVVSSHQVTKVLELHHQSFQWYSRLTSFKIDWVFYKLLSVFCY